MRRAIVLYMLQPMRRLDEWGIDIFHIDNLTQNRSLAAMSYTILKVRQYMISTLRYQDTLLFFTRMRMIVYWFSSVIHVECFCLPQCNGIGFSHHHLENLILSISQTLFFIVFKSWCVRATPIAASTASSPVNFICM